MTMDIEKTLRFSRSTPSFSLRRERERETEEKRERQAMPQQKTIVIPPEGDVNFCAGGQCYRRQARSGARLNFVRFYTRIGWSSTRSLSLPAPALPNCHLPRVARGAHQHLGRYPMLDAGERPTAPLPRTHLHLEETDGIFIPLRRYRSENKTPAFLPIIGNKVAGADASRRIDKQSERETKGRRRRRVFSRESVCGFIASTTEE